MRPLLEEFISLIKRLYKDVQVGVIVRKKMRLKKNNVYIVRVQKMLKRYYRIYKL